MNIFDQLLQALGPDIVHRGDEDGMDRYRGDILLSMAEGSAPAAIVLPRTVEQVAATLALCNESGTPVTAQGGRTGVVGGAVPEAGGVVLSLERMRGIIELDPDAATLTVEAGVPLESVQAAADEAGLLFPLDLGARGSCTIAGNAATNAGGNRVLRYGMMRDLVLGMEVVLADGTIISTLNKMIKNNAGYDVKQMFIGSEGTLGVITKLVLKLFPKPASTCTALCSLDSYADAMKLLAHCRRELAGSLSAFEVMWPGFYDLASNAVSKFPLPPGRPCYVLFDMLGTDPEADQQRFEKLLELALEDAVITDAVIAQSVKQTAELWAVRDSILEVNQALGPNASFDVSIPTGRIDEFVESCNRLITERSAQARALWFGHVVDSNVHLKVSCDDNLPEEAAEALVYEQVRRFGGSVSAEHGIGLAKRPWLDFSRSPAEVELMRRMKRALDPKAILNPGKILNA